MDDLDLDDNIDVDINDILDKISNEERFKYRREFDEIIDYTEVYGYGDE